MCEWMSHCPNTWKDIKSASCRVIPDFRIWAECDIVRNNILDWLSLTLRTSWWNWETAHSFFRSWWAWNR